MEYTKRDWDHRKTKNKVGRHHVTQAMAQLPLRHSSPWSSFLQIWQRFGCFHGYPNRVNIQQSRLGYRQAIAFIEAILHKPDCCPLHERCTMKQYIGAKRRIEIPNPPTTTSQQTLDQILCRKRVDPYDLVPKLEVGNLWRNDRNRDIKV